MRNGVNGRALLADADASVRAMRAESKAERRRCPPLSPEERRALARRAGDVVERLRRPDFGAPSDVYPDQQLTLPSIASRSGGPVMTSVRVVPVFFAGDAAHLIPIFGIRGLNSGVASFSAIAS